MEYTCTQLKEALQNGEKIYLADVREGWEMELVKLDNSQQHLLSKLSEDLPTLADIEEPIVFICHHGVRSLNATQQLRQFGKQNCYSLKGGIDVWAKTIDTSLRTY